MRKRSAVPGPVLALVLLVLIHSPLSAGEKQYNTMLPEELKNRIQAGTSQCILDIQVEEEFSEHHIRGAVPTYAYPVKTDEEKARLETEVARLKGSDDPVIIVCPRGGGGARRTYEYLLEKGIADDRLFILEKGQAGWPYGDLLEK